VEPIIRAKIATSILSPLILLHPLRPRLPGRRILRDLELSLAPLAFCDSKLRLALPHNRGRHDHIPALRALKTVE